MKLPETTPLGDPFVALPMVMLRDRRLKPADRELYAVLAGMKRIWHDDVRPTFEYLAALLGVRPGTIEERITKLRKLGFIRAGRSGRFHSNNRYVVTPLSKLYDAERRKRHGFFPKRKQLVAEALPYVSRVAGQKARVEDEISAARRAWLGSQPGKNVTREMRRFETLRRFMPDLETTRWRDVAASQIHMVTPNRQLCLSSLACETVATLVDAVVQLPPGETL